MNVPISISRTELEALLVGLGIPVEGLLRVDMNPGHVTATYYLRGDECGLVLPPNGDVATTTHIVRVTP